MEGGWMQEPTHGVETQSHWFDRLLPFGFPRHMSRASIETTTCKSGSKQVLIPKSRIDDVSFVLEFIEKSGLGELSEPVSD